MAEYDAIGDRYSEAKQAPWRIHLEAHTLHTLAGDVGGARVLDLACGDGFYSRRMKRWGAAETVGVDLSAEMIGLAREMETGHPLGCRYEVADVNDLGALGEFDIVVASYLLNYAHSRDELRRLCAAAGANLRPGGRLLGVNDYTDDGITGVRKYARHGFRKVGPDPYVEGTAIAYEFDLPGKRSFAITNYYWTPATYLEALREAGFRDAQWHQFAVSPAARPFPPGHWDDLVAGQPCAAFSATLGSVRA